ncbi:hypothetical protein RchiOBHm_Chr6g0262751 [Rosa chinensis]|uniref:Uncharacterized protein n=1 Tax=Rosa chinensis TaxID=74649 RepID=A0A2P6PNP6_ROSCH|nr:hypothetical protein RchiOBHm_Chr6g0262751 [Rosa chinensis]
MENLRIGLWRLICRSWFSFGVSFNKFANDNGSISLMILHMSCISQMVIHAQEFKKKNVKLCHAWV